MTSDNYCFRQFTQLIIANWLRPESALWYAHMLALAAEYLGPEIGQVTLDFGCMDGVNSFVLCGGEFGFRFDIYSEVAWSPIAEADVTPITDYFDVACDHTEPPDLAVLPARRFTYGVDWKRSHITRARRMRAHDRLKYIDAAAPAMDIANDSVDTIWAPNLYWAPCIETTLAELSRILHPEGRMVAIGPSTRQLAYMIGSHEGEMPNEWVKRMDRGRFPNTKRHARNIDEWTGVFSAANLSVIKHTPFISPLVARAYDIGFRPLFPVFMHAYEAIKSNSPDEWEQLKRTWVETVTYLARPLCRRLTATEEDSAAWFIFELRKKVLP